MRHKNDYQKLTKCHISVSHPGCYSKVLERSKPCNLCPCEQIPYNSSLPDVITEDQSTSSPFTNIINRYKVDLLLMKLEPSFKGQCVMMETQDHRTLREEE